MKKTALITGGGRGIGAACARALAQKGCEVVLNYNSSEAEATSLAQELGGSAVRADVSSPEAVAAMFAAVPPQDILVCNAGVALQKLLTDTSVQEWRSLLDKNLGGAISCCQAAIPAMVRSNWGRIILISSVWGVYGASCEAIYSASKAALIGLTKALAKELGPSGITVNCVAPGVIETDMNKGLDGETMAALCDCTPLGAIGQPEDVAAAVAFLASDEARFITGQVLGVDGGFTG